LVSDAPEGRQVGAFLHQVAVIGARALMSDRAQNSVPGLGTDKVYAARRQRAYRVNNWV
jgi:hypothetical protein